MADRATDRLVDILADRLVDILVDILADRLVDIALESISASLYCVYNVRVTAMLEDMVDFFSYTNTIAYSSAPLSSR